MNEYLPIIESTDSTYKASLWDTAKGLQAVDGLKTSQYLDDIAQKNINNEITYSEAIDSVKNYYGSSCELNESIAQQREADIVSIRIVEYLNTHTFTYGLPGLISIHEYLFKDVLGDLDAGYIRKGNIYKKEHVLNGDTVDYGDFGALRIGIDLVFSSEKRYNYSFPFSQNDIRHISEFVSELWTLHPFKEGNTRTTAVYLILYMRNKGISITNDMFKENSLYFRNALVRSVYENIRIGIKASFEYLDKFFNNLFLQTDYSLDNNELQLPINEEYQNEIQMKLSRINSNELSDSELFQLSNDKNADVRSKAIDSIKSRLR